MWYLKSEKKLNIADWFSIYRILAIPVLLSFMALDLPIWFAVFLLISLSTDMIDGMLARRYKLVSQRGAQLDSIGDALTFIAGFVGVAYFKWDFVLEQWIPIVVVFGFYLLQLGLAYFRYGMPSSFHTYAAKLAALVQGVFMVSLFFFGEVMWLFYAVIIISFLETLEEMILIIMLPKWKSDVKGIWWVVKGNDKWRGERGSGNEERIDSGQ